MQKLFLANSFIGILSVFSIVRMQAQTTYISYVDRYSSVCQPFYPSMTIDGVIHRPTNWTQRFMNNSGITLESSTGFPGVFYESTYKIHYTFTEDHYYKVTITAARASSTSATPRLSTFVTDIVGGSNACNIFSDRGDFAGSPGFSSHLVTSNTFQDYIFDIHPSTTMDYMEISSRPDLTMSSEIQYVTISNITIEDITSTLTLFRTRASETERVCGGTTPITFTIENVNSTPGVTGYEFYTTPGKWYYDGAPAPNPIYSSTNSITLTPVPCASATNVSGKAYIGGVVHSTPSIHIPVLIPTYNISGPDVLDHMAGIYQVTLSPTSVESYCAGPYTWSVDNGLLATVTYNPARYYEADLMPRFKGGSGNVVLRADIPLCGVISTATKSVEIINGFGLSPISETKAIDPEQETVRLYPNPATDVVNIIFNKEAANAKIIIEVVNGRIVKEDIVSGKEVNMDISDLAPGVYILKINDGTNVTVQKIVKR